MSKKPDSQDPNEALLQACRDKKMDNITNLIENQRADPNYEDEKGDTPLCIAIQLGNIPMIELLVNKGANVDHVIPSQKRSPLHFAVSLARFDIVMCIGEKRPNFNALDENGNIALVAAINNKQRDIARYLAGKPSNHDWKEKDAGGHALMQRLVTQGHNESVDFFLDIGLSPHSKDANGDTLLHHAARAGHASVVDVLLQRGAILCENLAGENAFDVAVLNRRWDVLTAFATRCTGPLIKMNQSGTTVMHRLAAGGVKGGPAVAADAIRRLADSGCEIGIKDAQGNTAVHVAASAFCDQSGPSSTLMALLEKGADHSAANERGEKPLHSAAYWGRSENIEILLTKGCDVNSLDSYGASPLHFAAAQGRANVIPLLCERGATVNLEDGQGQTPLQVALDKRKSDGALALIACQANCRHEHPVFGTILHQAVFLRFEEVVSKMVESGVSPNAVNEKGRRAALHIAVEQDLPNTIRVLCQQGKAIVDIKESDTVRTPLHFACLLGRTECASVLVEECGASVHARDADECTPLVCVGKVGNEEIAKMLIAHGAEVDAQDSQGRTSLHYASSLSFPLLSDALITAGRAKVDIKDHGGLTPLHLAVSSGSVDCVQVLIDGGASLNLPDAKGRTPLLLSAAAGQVHIGTMLIRSQGPTKMGQTLASTC